MKILVLSALVLMGSLMSPVFAAPQQSPWQSRSASALRRQQLGARLVRLQLQRTALQHEYRPGAPEIRAIEREIASVQRELARLRLPIAPRFLPPATRPRFQLL